MKSTLNITLTLLLSCLFLNAQNKVKDHTAMFENMDKDKDSRVTEAEFWDLWNTFFTYRDKDKDQLLSLSDYFLKQDKKNYITFARVDKNKDGEVDLEEEKAFRMSHFMTLDSDGSKTLDIEEISQNAED